MENTPDTSSLAPEPEIDDVGQGVVDFLWKRHRTAYLLALWGSVLAGALICAYEFMTGIANVSTGDVSSLLWAFVPLIVPGAMNIYASQVAHHEMMLQIAQSFGFTYAKSAPMPVTTGVTFCVGHGRRLSDVMTGVYREFPTRIFGYTYTVGYGKSAHTYADTIMEFTYPTALPHIILGPHSFFAFEEMHFPSDVEAVELEGDFGSHFSLYISKNAQLEAREIFEPDLMQALIANYTEYRFEIVGNTFYFIRTGAFVKRADFIAMRDLADSLIDKLIPGLRSAAEDTVPASVAA